MEWGRQWDKHNLDMQWGVPTHAASPPFPFNRQIDLDLYKYSLSPLTPTSSFHIYLPPITQAMVNLSQHKDATKNNSLLSHPFPTIITTTSPC